MPSMKYQYYLNIGLVLEILAINPEVCLANIDAVLSKCKHPNVRALLVNITQDRASINDITVP